MYEPFLTGDWVEADRMAGQEDFQKELLEIGKKKHP
jgi:hypothetical protein